MRQHGFLVSYRNYVDSKAAFTLTPHQYESEYRCAECRRNFRFCSITALSPVYSDTTQLNSTRRRVELSCVELCRCKRGFSEPLCMLLHTVVSALTAHVNTLTHFYTMRLRCDARLTSTLRATFAPYSKTVKT